MSYQVLARKWRPQTFADVVGQKHVMTILANCLSLRRIHHAYLFSGTRGVGKTSIARLLAKGLSCKIGITNMPCGVCDNCCEIEQGRFVDLVEIDAASRTKVEDIRELLDNIQYAPAYGRFKVYLIDEVHMLSRHSFNALLKTLEEPPTHVKFMLATTDPQKLPMTILSRCLHFHLKALEVEQIRDQLEHILDAENIVHEPHALKLLASAAKGSLRDALSLTEQAIASGNGKLVTESVSAMLGNLNDDQALSLIEAIIDANGERALSLLNTVAARGIEWEVLLVEMLTLFHRLAMIQLSPSAISEDMTAINEQRLRKIASIVPPAEIQLYYQILLVGRKELPFAPDRRMGVEMTMLRALAFHPHTASSEPLETTLYRSFIPSAAQTTVMKSTQQGGTLPQPSLPPKSEVLLPSNNVDSALVISCQLNSKQEAINKNSSELAIIPNETQLVNSIMLERLASIKENIQSYTKPSIIEQKKLVKKKVYYCKETTTAKEVETKMTTSKISKKTLEYEKIPELTARIVEESIARDAWTAEIKQLQLTELVEQVALNAWKEQNGNQICLHLRSDQKHLNLPSTQKALAEALAILYGSTIELTIIEDDDSSVRTPMEWRQAIYEEKLVQAREILMADNNIQIIRRFFDADLDEESIRP